jgi:hypothetical protein
MDARTLLVTVSCLIDDWLAGRRLRQPGPTPVLSDSEVLTIECVGEVLGIDTDKGLDDHFRDWFPALGASTAPPSPARRPTCGQARLSSASSCSPRSASTRRSRSWTASPCRSAALAAPTVAAGWPGWRASAATRAPSRPATGSGPTCGGCWPGVITDARLVPANLHDLVLAEELWPGARVGTGGSGLLEPFSYRAPGRAGPRAPGAAVAVGQGQGAEAAEVGDAHQATDRDGARPAGGARPRQTGLGP